MKILCKTSVTFFKKKLSLKIGALLKIIFKSRLLMQK